MNMEQPLLEILPQELIICILECVCDLIIKELATLKFRQPKTPYGSTLNQFLQLNLVSKSFYHLLAYSIRVDGQPIKKRLLDLQMQKFTDYLESAEGYLLGRGRFIAGRRQCETLVIWKTCGQVWKNPPFVNIVPQLLLEEGNYCWSSEAAMYFLFQLKQFLDKEQVEGEQNRKYL